MRRAVASAEPIFKNHRSRGNCSEQCWRAPSGRSAGASYNRAATTTPAANGESRACSPMVDDLDEVMKQRRSLEKALAELQANYRRRPSATLARMIEQLKAELAFRKELLLLRDSNRMRETVAGALRHIHSASG